MNVSNFELDAQFLEQFSCLGTNDKEDLIKTFQTVVGNGVASQTSRFFLELANWNLQRAVGAYFDYSYDGGQSEMEAASTSYATQFPITPCNSLSSLPNHIYDSRICYSPNAEPSRSTTLGWCVQNCGTCQWMEGSYIRAEVSETVAKLSTILPNSTIPMWIPLQLEARIPLPCILPENFTNVSLELLPPSADAYSFMLSSGYPVVTALSLCLPSGERFGELLYCTARINLTTKELSYSVGAAAVQPVDLSEDCAAMDEL